MIALQDYMAKSVIVDCKEDSAKIKLSQKDWEFIFDQLLFSAIFAYDNERLYYKLHDILERSIKLIENVIARNEYLEDFSDYQSIMIRNQKQMIEDLTQKLLEKESD